MYASAGRSSTSALRLLLFDVHHCHTLGRATYSTPNSMQHNSRHALEQIWVVCDKQAEVSDGLKLSARPGPQPSTLCAQTTHRHAHYTHSGVKRGHSSQHVQRGMTLQPPCSCSSPDTHAHTLCCREEGMSDPALSSSQKPREGLAAATWVCMPLLLN